MESPIKVSVVMPTFNRGKVIGNAIRGIIDQTFKNWELIIVDDGSTDGTKMVIDGFAHPRIKYQALEHSGMVSRVRNAGNQLATGDIVVVQDSDDVSFPDRIEEIVKAFQENPGTDLVYHGMYSKIFDPYHNAYARMIYAAHPYEKEHLLKEQYIPGQCAYTRERILKIPYDERIHCCDDYQMLLEFALNDCKFVPIFKNLYEYNNFSDSINVLGEMDGRRKKDVEVILNILKEKYNVDGHAMLTKIIADTGDIIKQEII